MYVKLIPKSLGVFQKKKKGGDYKNATGISVIYKLMGRWLNMFDSINHFEENRIGRLYTRY